MKKLMIPLALFLCVVLLVSAFASCSKKKATDTTAAPDTTPGTTATATVSTTDNATANTTAATTAEATTAATTEATTEATTAHVHVAATEYTVDLEPTCTTAGSKSYHCTVCNEIIPETVVAIEVIPHTPATEYTVDLEPTCTTAGSKSYHCSVCSAIIPETEVAVEVIPHTAETEYTIDVEATCAAPGSKSYHCSVCHGIIAETVVAIPINDNSHAVSSWETTAATLLSNGSRHGECAVCHQDIVETFDKTEPLIYNSGDKAAGSSTYTATSGDNANDVLIKERIYNIQNASGKKFYPTQDDPTGNDLLVEFSILWNETLENSGDKSDDGNSARFSFQIGEGYSFYELTTRSNHNSGNWSNTFGDITPRNYTTVNYPDPFVNPNIGGYGWHRIGIRIHQEAAIDGNGVAYTYIVTYYIDGVRVVEIDATTFATASNRRMLFSATNDNGTLVYSDPVNKYDALVWVKATEFFKNSSGAYLGLGDVSITCGKTFVQQVERVESPVADTLEVAEGVTVPATVYYRIVTE